MENPKRFARMALTFNIAGLHIPGGDSQDCNPGGSIICDPGTGGCGSGGMSCVGSSCSNDSSFMGCGAGSEVFDPSMDAHILVAHERLAELRKELQAVVSRYTASE